MPLVPGGGLVPIFLGVAWFHVVSIPFMIPFGWEADPCDLQENAPVVEG